MSKYCVKDDPWGNKRQIDEKEHQHTVEDDPWWNKRQNDYVIQNCFPLLYNFALHIRIDR